MADPENFPRDGGRYRYENGEFVLVESTQLTAERPAETDQKKPAKKAKGGSDADA